MPAHQQAAQFVGLELVGLEAIALKVAEQLFLPQAGVVFLVMGQVQLARVGEKLVTEAAARAAAHHADHMGAMGQGDFHEDVAGVRRKVEAARLFEAVLAEAHV